MQNARFGSRWLATLIAALGLALCAASSRAAVTWTNTAGSWDVAANWSPNQVPTDGDDVVITNTGASVLLAGASSNLNSLVLSKTLTFTNWNTRLNATTVTIQASGIITLPAAFTDIQMSNNVYIVCSNLFIATNGKIDADYKGWAGATAATTSGNGPGKGGWTGSPSTYAGGGGYGGRGGDVAAGGRALVGGVTYGSETAPVDPGSGGGEYYASGKGGAGGGAVRIAASGTVTVNGSIFASGKVGTAAGGGGGSGGGVYITCYLFAGTNGTVTADGGNGDSGYGSGAGGGRIAVAYTNVTNPKPKVSFSAKGGILGSGVGDLGTLYFTDSSILDGSWFPHSGRLVIPGFNAWSPASLTVTNGTFRFPQVGFHLTVAGDLTVKGSSTTLEIGGTDFAALKTNYCSGTTSAPLVEVGGNLIITNSATLCVYAAATNASTAPHGARVNVSGSLFVASNSFLLPYSDCTNGGSVYIAAGNMTVAAAGSINASGKGFGGAMYYTGSGFGYGKGSAAAGAGYGGKGGDGTSPTTTGGSTYGSSNAPTQAGSGGGSQYASMVGGAGGGRVWLKSGGAVTVNGTISANGNDGSNVGAGGGSGGSVFIQCLRFEGSSAGTLSANGGIGGSGGGYGGGGGGGRIAVWYGSMTPFAEAELLGGGIPKNTIITTNYAGYTGTNTVTGGAGQSTGIVGTIVFLRVPPPSGTMIMGR